MSRWRKVNPTVGIRASEEIFKQNKGQLREAFKYPWGENKLRVQVTDGMTAYAYTGNLAETSG